MIEKIKEVERKVKLLLTEKPDLRDSDTKLIANIWCKEIGGKKVAETTSAFCLLEAMSHGKHTSPEAIVRARRRVQEKNPFLRGQFYGQRKKSEKEVREKIKSI